MKFLRVVVVVMVAAVAFWQGATPAQADPHAMFFTSIAQKQLFFNVLAALDQADYVEPPGDTPCPNGGICDPALNRQELAERREAAEFTTDSDNHPALAATKTGLATTLTREVTLDGTDLWTAHLLKQRALEHDRRNALSELIQVYCNVGLGECNGALTPDDVFVTDPQKPAKEALLGVAGALVSGTTTYEDMARNQYQQNQLAGGGVPIPYNPTVAAMWASAGDDETKQRLLLAAAGTATRTLSQPTVPTGVFDYVDVNDDGEVTLAANLETERPSLIARLLRPFTGNTAHAQQEGNVSLQDQVMGTIYGVATLPVRLLEVAISASNSVTAFHDYTTGPNGERAAHSLALQGGRDANGDLELQGVRANIDAPGYVAPQAVGGLVNAATANDVPQDAVVGPEPNGTTISAQSGLEIIDLSPPRCYVPGENFPIKFTIRNHSNKTPSGRVWLSKVGGSQSDAKDRIDANGSAQPPALSGGNTPDNFIQWQTTVPAGGERTFIVNDQLSADYSPSEVLAYTVTFFHTATTIDGTGVHRLRIERGSQCTNGLPAVRGTQDTNGNGGAVLGESDSAGGQVLQATTQSGGSGGDYENPGEALVRPHDEPGVAAALRALGRDESEPSLLNKALGN